MKVERTESLPERPRKRQQKAEAKSNALRNKERNVKDGFLFFSGFGGRVGIP